MKRKAGGPIVMLLICLYLVIPLVFTFLYAVSGDWSGLLPRGITFRYYAEIFSDPAFLLSLLRTLVISVLPVVLCTIFVLLAMFVITAYHPWMDRYMQILCTIPYAIQGVIIAISVLALYANAPPPLGNRILMLTATYCVVALPYIYQGIKNSLNSVNAGCLIEAAQILGASKFAAFFRVIVPNIMPGVTVSAMLSVSILFGDFVVVNTLAGNYYQTAQVYLYHALFRSGQLSSAIVIALFGLTLLISLCVFFLKRRGAPGGMR